jgi:Dolichyl-phosphate-mannose-protein mannosyltransferase
MFKRHYARWGLCVAAVANLALAAMCVLGAEGQNNVATVEVTGNRFRTSVDGFQVVPDRSVSDAQFAELDLPATGSISLLVGFPIPSLPHPQGIDSVVVRDRDGTVLFSDDFDSLQTSRWQVVSGHFRIEDGVLVAGASDVPNALALDGAGWQDYTLEVRLQNAVEAELGVRRAGDGGLFYHVFLQRAWPAYVYAKLQDGTETGFVEVTRTNTAQSGSLTSMAAMVAGSYPLALLALAAGGVAASVLALLELWLSRALPGPAEGIQGRTLRPSIARAGWLGLVLVLAVAAVGVTAHIMWVYYDGVPHLPDEVSYIFQAKLFAEGRLTTAVPSVKEAMNFWEPSWLYEREGRWSTAYPLGHPLALAPGEALGVIWLVPPLLGGASVALIGLVGRRLYDPVTGLLAALLLAGSPFFLMQAGSFMSHITWVFFILMSMFFMTQRDKTPLFGAFAGLFYGLAINTRAIEALVLIPAFAVALTWPLLRRENRKEALGRCLGFLAGGTAAGLMMLAYNAALTGDPLTSAYADAQVTGDILGFTSGHTLNVGLKNLQALLWSLILLLNGWPVLVGITLVLLPFLLGTRNQWDYFCLACVVLVTCVYVFYPWTAGPGALYEGPRYWFQAVPFLMLLSARGAALAARLIGQLATWTRSRLAGDLRPARWAGAAVVMPVLLFLVADGTGGWVFGWNNDWSETNVPQVQNDMESINNLDYFDFDERLVRLKDDLQLRNALVLVQVCGPWVTDLGCYGTVFVENSVDFNGDVVWARYIPELNERLIAAHPGRDVYVATWDPVAIVPYQQEEPSASEAR